MKKILYILCAVLTLPFINGCSQHEIPLYEGEDAIFFDQQYGVAWFDTVRLSHQIYSLIPFGLMVEDDSLLQVKVETTGYVRNYDRPFSIEVVADSTTAIEGEEYEVLEMNPVITAGNNSVYIPVKIHRSARLSGNAYQVQLRIIPGQHFTLPFSEDGFGEMPKRANGGEVYVEYSTNFDPSIHNIFISGKLQKPTQWHNNNMGPYSDTKFALILELVADKYGWTVKDFEDSRMLGSRSVLVARLLSSYLLEQYNKGREYWVLDEDGSMMYCSGVRWTVGQDPDTFI